MIKIHCDRCEEEIKNKYYTINIYSHDVNPKYDSYTVADCVSSCNRDDILRTLNATKMYCKNCRDEIWHFINNK